MRIAASVGNSVALLRARLLGLRSLHLGEHLRHAADQRAKPLPRHRGDEQHLAAEVGGESVAHLLRAGQFRLADADDLRLLRQRDRVIAPVPCGSRGSS